MKKGPKIFSFLIIVILLLSVPCTILGVGFSKNVFDNSYYAELPDMYENLSETKGKKIVIIGTSSVAFGVDSSLFEKELENASLDYSVCNFGLYGALGTKLMLDLAMDTINEGDIVIIAPEISSQTLSLYFSAENTWYAIEGNKKLLNKIKKENKSSMVGNYLKYVQKKYQYLTDPSLGEISGVYSHSSFDENCNLRAERKENIMLDGYDANNMIDLSSSLYSSDFIDYLNDYHKNILSKKATLFYDFAPMNESAVINENDMDALYDFLNENLSFEILGNPHHAIYESRCFYDSNFHLNDEGMVINTLRLVDDIKEYYGNTTADITSLPTFEEENEEDEEEVYVEDNSNAMYFNYELEEDGTYVITGISEEGKNMETLIVPSSYSNLPVKEIISLENAENLKTIIIPKTIKRIRDNCFANASLLESIYLYHDNPKNISVGYKLLEGTKATVIVKRDVFSAFMSDYTWSYYSGRLSYEK